jgi:hypothetical protein
VIDQAHQFEARVSLIVVEEDADASCCLHVLGLGLEVAAAALHQRDLARHTAGRERRASEAVFVLGSHQ